MALKRKITRAEYDALSDVIKAEYKANGDGFVLDTDDATDLINARDLERREKEEVRKKLKEAQDEIAAIKKAGGDWESLEASYRSKIATLEKEKGELNTTLTSERRERFVTAEASKIAARFTVPSLMQEQIAKRLDVDPKDGKTVKVLDKDGKMSALTLADLEKEFVDNPEFKGIVIASKATGSAGSANGGSATKTQIPNDPNTGKPRLLSSMSPIEIAAARKAAREAEQQ